MTLAWVRKFSSLISWTLAGAFLVLPSVTLGAPKAGLFTSLFADATVFRDRIANGLLDSSEKQTRTRSDGRFRPPKGKGRLLLVGGTEITTGKQNALIIAVPAEARAASTLTAFWQALLDRGSNRAKNSKLLKLPAKTSIRNLKAVPIQGTTADSKQERLLKRDAEFNVLVSFSKSLSSARLGIAGRRTIAVRKLEGSAVPEDPDVGAMAQALLNLNQGVPDITDLSTVRRLFAAAFQILGVSLAESDLTVVATAAVDIIRQLESARALFDKIQRIRANAAIVIAARNYGLLNERYTGDGLIQQIQGDVYDPSLPTPTPTPTPSPTPTTSPTPTPALTPALNDTGVVRCADGTSNDLTCPVSGLPGQDAEFGRDATASDDSDGHAGFSFAKLGADGSLLSPDASAWVCVRDNVTGLTWEVKTNDGGLHDLDLSYTNFSLTFDPNQQRGGPGDATGFVTAANREGFCGASDWRLPDVEELESLLDLSVSAPGPLIDSRFFGNTRTDNGFWTSEGFASGDDSSAWIVRFDDGTVGVAARSSAVQPIRLVRGGQ